MDPMEPWRALLEQAREEYGDEEYAGPPPVDHDAGLRPVPQGRIRRALLNIGVTVVMLAGLAIVVIVVGVVLLFILSHSTPTCGIAATGPNC